MKIVYVAIITIVMMSMESEQRKCKRKLASCKEDLEEYKKKLASCNEDLKDLQSRLIDYQTKEIANLTKENEKLRIQVEDYALHFPVKGVSDFVNVWGMPSLTQFTVCLWMKSSDAINEGTLFSYALPGPGADNEIAIYYPKSFHFLINGSAIPTSTPANDGNWHQICVSWENSLGSWKLYKDGTVAAQGAGFKTGHVIKSGGCFTLAQEQDFPGGGFEAEQSFIGMLTNVNVWDHALPTEQIEQMSKSCLSGEGNVYKWSHFIHGREGNAQVVIPSPCKP